MNSISISGRLLAGMAAAALMAGSLAACGSDDSTSSSSSALSKDDFISQANAICKKHGDAINKQVKTYGGPIAGADLRDFVKSYVRPQYAAQMGQIGQLVPPDEIADDVDTWIADSTELGGALGDDPASALDPSTYKKVNQEASDLGLGDDCQVGPTS